MNNYLISEAIGNITGSDYEGRRQRIKDYDIYQTMKMLPDWIVKVSERFDEVVNSNKEG